MKANDDDEHVREPFEYMVGKTKIVLPSLTWLKPGVFRKIRNMDGLNRLYALLEMSLNEKQLAAVDDMEPDEFNDMCQAWNDHSGITLGESKASTS
ncbi:hypothetical protein [Nocardia sp. NPDC019255]|uniref:hypothetical protein n=1 Tax=Nocardia sp. NPDC019255 TaxID=3154591 RepID=UPI0033DA9E46